MLGFKKGDLNLIHSVTYRCKVRDLEKRLVLKKLDCLDQSVYNAKIHEVDLLKRMAQHPNIVKLYTYWNEDSGDPFTYKSLYLLFEECMVGDIHRCIVQNPLRPSAKTIMKYICDLCKGLTLLHQSGTIHGGIRPTNLFINQINDLQIGPIKKSNLESMRKTWHLISKFCIERYMKHYFIYWAPEVILGKALSTGSDIWSLGVMTYLLLTGDYPFTIEQEDQTVNNILNVNINWRPLNTYPKAINMLENIF